ncbi:MAG TPA: hypothetical protein VH834_10430 [Solirubrobacteraceae bacterium]
MLLSLLCLLCLAALAPAGASAAGPQPPNCPIYAPHAAVEHSLTLPNGTELIARDPYGGLLPRNRLFFDFTVQKAGGGRGPQGVAQVTWALDGKVVRTDPTAPYEWKGVSGSSRRMPAGDHQITVTVTPSGGGAPVSTTFALTATDCQPAGTFANLDVNLPGNSKGHAPEVRGSELDAWSAFESDDGPTMRSVTFLGSGVRARIPSAARGRAAGTLKTDTGRTYHLRVPRRGTTLLRHGSLRVVLHPGAKRFMSVSGLPSGVHTVMLRLVGRGGDVLALHHTSARTCVYVTRAQISGPDGSVQVDGGTGSGSCPRA